MALSNRRIQGKRSNIERLRVSFSGSNWPYPREGQEDRWSWLSKCREEDVERYAVAINFLRGSSLSRAQKQKLEPGFSLLKWSPNNANKIVLNFFAGYFFVVFGGLLSHISRTHLCPSGCINSQWRRGFCSGCVWTVEKSQRKKFVNWIRIPNKNSADRPNRCLSSLGGCVLFFVLLHSVLSLPVLLFVHPFIYCITCSAKGILFYHHQTIYWQKGKKSTETKRAGLSQLIILCPTSFVSGTKFPIHFAQIIKFEKSLYIGTLTISHQFWHRKALSGAIFINFLIFLNAQKICTWNSNLDAF